MNDLANPRWNAAILEQEAVSAHGPQFTHELGNLVQVVSGYLELLAARTEDEVSLRYIATAQTAARQIAELNLDLDRRPRARKSA
jgi:hypothetical protein